MTVAERIRAKLLDLAIRGKLTPQDANDEPADVLLSKIRDEKAGLINAKKIKKGKLFLPVTDDDTLFELPNGWAWCRLGEICSKIGAGSTPRGGKSVYVKHGIKFIREQNVYNDGICEEGMAFIDEYRNSKMAGTVVRPCDLLMNITGASIGRTALVPDDFDIGNVNQHVLIVRLVEPCARYYVHLVLCSRFIVSLMLRSQTGDKPGLSAEKVSGFPIPLPPLAEQKRIVTKLEKLLKIADALGECTEKFDDLSDKARAKILDLAIRGKLVQQDSNDEPADALLAKIRDEKEKLVKAKKIKKEKPLPPITYDEKPFDLPRSWVWCRLGEVCNYGECTSEKDVPNDAWVLDLEDIEKGTGKLLSRVISQERQSTSAKHVFKKGMLLYSKLRTYLNKVLVADKDGYCTSEILPLDFGNTVDVRYARQVLMSPYFLDYAASCCYGVKMPRLGTDDGRKALFPLPPLAEQKRIVAKVEAMLAACDKLKGACA